VRIRATSAAKPLRRLPIALGGELRQVTGIVTAALAARAAGRRLILPAANAGETTLVPGVNAAAAQLLLEVIADLVGTTPLAPMKARTPAPAQEPLPALDDVRGHAAAKRALAVAAAGDPSGHRIIRPGLRP
jgi:magnesium chelatase family protein